MADFTLSVADFTRGYIRNTNFLNKGLKLEREKAYFGAEVLQIWWKTIKTHSHSSIYMYGFYFCISN